MNFIRFELNPLEINKGYCAAWAGFCGWFRPSLVSGLAWLGLVAQLRDRGASKVLDGGTGCIWLADCERRWGKRFGSTTMWWCASLGGQEREGAHRSALRWWWRIEEDDQHRELD
jgi:hypothetical protein